MSTTDELDQKRSLVGQKIKRREEERLAENQQRTNKRDDDIVQEETLEYFLKQFSAKKAIVDDKLNEASTLSPSVLAAHFDDIQSEFQSLQKILTESASHIKSYELQKAQSSLAALQTTLTETRAKLIPKKKFALKSRKKTSAQPNKPEVVAPVKPQSHIDQENECNIGKLENQTISKESNELNNKDVSLRELNGCKVFLSGAPSAMHINKLNNCEIFSGPVSGSVFIDNCQDCTFVIPCQQLRIHSTTNTSFYIHVTSRAIIEDSNTLLFAPYNWSYPTLEEHYLQAGLDKSRNSWDDVDDFNWLASDAHSPNWAVMPEDQRRKWST